MHPEMMVVLVAQSDQLRMTKVQSTPPSENTLE